MDGLNVADPVQLNEDGLEHCHDVRFMTQSCVNGKAKIPDTLGKDVYPQRK